MRCVLYHISGQHYLSINFSRLFNISTVTIQSELLALGNYFCQARFLNKKTPKPPSAKVSISGMVIESTSMVLLVPSVLPWRNLSPWYSRRRLLRLSIWCMIWRWLREIASICWTSYHKDEWSLVVCKEKILRERNHDQKAKPKSWELSSSVAYAMQYIQRNTKGNVMCIT